MSSNKQQPPQPPLAGWDIACTRLVTVLSSRIRACFHDLEFLFNVAGMRTRVVDRVTPVGVVLSMQVYGYNGLLCSVDYNLVDGMVDCHTPGLALDVNLLNSDSEVLSFCTSIRNAGARGYSANLNDILTHAGHCLNASQVYDLVTRDFDLLAERPRRAA